MTNMKDVLVNLEHISKSYDGQLILDDLNLYIRENEFLTLLGPSGCGKTTTLRLIAGFLEPNAGKVLLKGEDITGVPPYKRPVRIPAWFRFGRSALADDLLRRAEDHVIDVEAFEVFKHHIGSHAPFSF